MKTWLFLTDDFFDTDCIIPNRTPKAKAIKIAKAYMKERGMKSGWLQASYLLTDEIAYTVEVRCMD